MDVTKELAERLIELYNAGDVDALMELYAEDAVLRAPELTAEGRTAIRAFWTEQFTEFPDSHITPDLLIQQDGVVATEFTYTGTNTGPIVTASGDIRPATGKRIEMQGMELIKLRGGAVVRHAIYHDEVPVMAQLGLLPETITA